MHRFRVDGVENDQCTLSREEAAHALKVLRMRPGDICEVSDGERLFSGVLEENARVKITGELSSRESPARVTLYQGYPKADKLEMILQKFTELGGYRLVPVLTSRSVARPDEFEKKRERFERIAQEAAKQSGRARTPEISPMMTFEEAARDFEKRDLAILFWEDERNTRLKDARAERPDAKDIGYFIGPEGGLSAPEADRLRQAGGMVLTLGERILRAETAAVAGCALMRAMWGDI